MNNIQKMMETFEKYVSTCSEVTREINQLFLEKGLGVTVGIVEDYYIELLFKPNRVNSKKRTDQLSVFYETLDLLCDVYKLTIVTRESCLFENMEFDEEFCKFYHEKIILKGEKDER